MSLKVIRNEISAVQQELLLKLEIKSIAIKSKLVSYLYILPSSNNTYE